MTHAPSYHSHEEYQNRLRKLLEIRALGINPYPAKYVTTTKAKPLQLECEGKELPSFDQAASFKSRHLFISGRLVLFRAMGKNAFGHIQDETGRIQVLFNRDLTRVKGLKGEETPLKFIEKKLDLGDLIGVEGHLFQTQKGELTLFATEVTLLSKSLLPLPDKHAGLVDKGVRYRKRWLDLITHPESIERFRLRSRILLSLRKYMEAAKFEEVETPVLQNIYGGAEARPFTTHLNALDQEMYLRISPEISLKKLIIGGMERIYEIGKVFRNEGIDRTHNPEFTMMEAYAAGWDYLDMMEFTENFFEQLALDLFGQTQIRHSDGTLVDLKAPWKRLTMKEAIRTYGHFEVDAKGDAELKKRLLACSIAPQELEGLSRGLLIQRLFEELVEPHLIQPHHIIDHPIETTPLCKPHRDPVQAAEGLVERFESFILGTEFCNSYTELNDPVLQRDLLVAQGEKRLAGDEEAHPLDEEFIEAVCQGMPPTGGLGIGIDRLVMLFTVSPSIRDVLFFPLMRPEE